MVQSSDRMACYIPAVQLFAARLVLFHQRVAERLGLTATEFKCARLVERLGPMTVTQLAREAGLRLGTVSDLVDRLEKGGFLERVRDGEDRRRVLLAATPEAAGRASGHYRELGQAMAEVLQRYDDRDFEAVMRFLQEGADVLAQAHGDGGPSRRASPA